MGKKWEEFHPLGFKSCVAMIFLSSISIFFSFIFKQGEPLLYLVLDSITFVFAEIALTYSIVNIVVIGHRASIIDNIKIKEKYFAKAIEKWKLELSDFPQIEKIIENLNGGKYVTQFFERGSFDLVILWSCSIMSNIVNLTTEPIIAKFPEKEKLFRQTKVTRSHETYIDFERCPVQLSNLGFNSCRNNKFNLNDLWETRNNIAHRTIKPSFSETIETLKVLVAFTDDLPQLLKAQLIA